ncbi:MAG: RluA family pseudouridine synthase [Patescibacteria group bacterium]
MPKGSEIITLSVPRRFVDKRLDFGLASLLKEEFPEHAPSRNTLSGLIQSGKVFRNGKVATPDTILSFEDVLTLERRVLLPDKDTLVPRKTDEVKVVWEGTEYVILYKSGNISMHPVEGRKSKWPTVANFILSRYPETVSVGEHPLRPGIVHRLDRETSGILVVARNQDAYLKLKSLFQLRKAEKGYLALVYGNIKEPKGFIATPLERVPGSLKRRVVSERGFRGSREAYTEYEVLIRYKEYDLVLVYPKTGRTHQIRVHFSSIGHPLVGDKLYSSKPSRSQSLVPARHLLHAFALEFPYTKQKSKFLAPLPPDFSQVLLDIDETRDAGYDGEALKSLFSEYEGRGFFVSDTL